MKTHWYEKVPQTPKTWMPYIVKHEGKWSDIRTVYASIGQDTVVVTPISMIRAVSSVGMRGKEYTPHFLHEFKPIGAVGQEGDPRSGQPQAIPQQPQPKAPQKQRTGAHNPRQHG